MNNKSFGLRFICLCLWLFVALAGGVEWERRTAA